MDLAAALRLAAHFDLNEGICNHFSVAIGDESYLLNPHGIHWSVVTASDLIVIGPEGAGDAEVTALHIHSAIHQQHPDAVCVMHTHMPWATALTCLERPHFRYVHQNSLRFFEDVAWDDDYHGLAESPEEGERIALAMGRAHVLFMAHHGVTVVGASVAEAFDRLYYLERACEVQVKAMSTGVPLREIGSDIARATKAQFDEGGTYAKPHLEALKQLLPPDYSGNGA
ncbi:MAG: class II aldolase/adducin family protein [Haliea sp.]|uniref:class II aldolase/adducin family protein n=1 Tax=Haliea sp. TaxID=1932666 RepID=UPI0032EF41FA